MAGNSELQVANTALNVLVQRLAQAQGQEALALGRAEVAEAKVAELQAQVDKHQADVKLVTDNPVCAEAVAA